MAITVSTMLENRDYESLAIPIPPKRSSCGYSTTSTTTPSLQSVLHQKRFSLRESISSQDISVSVASSSSLLTSVSDSEPCDWHPLESPSRNSYMDDIDHEFFISSKLQPVAPVHPGAKIIGKKSSFVSNLTRSIRSLTTATASAYKSKNELLFDIQPRLTDDKLPLRCQHTGPSRELETYKVTSQPSCTSQVTVHRARESRINSQFLRLYAHESNARQQRVLPEITQDEEEKYLNDPSTYEGSDREFALLVRQRLWQCVVLPPRVDALCDHTPEYIRMDGARPSVKPKGLKPWANLEDEKNGEMGPRGVLGKGTQFVVKGWCNSRWMPCNI